MENSTTNSNPRIQDTYVWFDEKQRSHFLFCSIDGREREGCRIYAVDAAKFRDGVIDAETLVAKYYPWVKDKEHHEEQGQQEKAEVGESIPQTNGQRFRSSFSNLVDNFYANGTKFASWVADIIALAWNDDGIGAYKEFAKGVDYAEKQVTKTVDFLHLEDAISKARTYLLSLYDTGGQLLRFNFSNARETLQPITSDLRTLSNFLFVKSGVQAMGQSLVTRTPETVRGMGGVFNGNSSESKQAGKVFIQETGKDMKAILHSESAQKTVNGILTGMEKLEKATKANNEEQQEQNQKREQDLDVKHPRLSQVRVYANMAGMNHFIRCCIDGVQQMGKPLKEQDYFSWKFGTLDRYQLAEKYYANDLNADLSRTASLSR